MTAPTAPTDTAAPGPRLDRWQPPSTERMVYVRWGVQDSSAQPNAPIAALLKSDTVRTLQPAVTGKPAHRRVSRIVLVGETFTVKTTSRRVRIVHPKWSLIGVGGSFSAALRDLLENAGIVVRVYGKMPRNTMDDEAFKMYRFAQSIS